MHGGDELNLLSTHFTNRRRQASVMMGAGHVLVTYAGKACICKISSRRFTVVYYDVGIPDERRFLHPASVHIPVGVAHDLWIA
jgi:hypothetical protein